MYRKLPLAQTMVVYRSHSHSTPPTAHAAAQTERVPSSELCEACARARRATERARGTAAQEGPQLLRGAGDGREGEQVCGDKLPSGEALDGRC